MASDNFHVCNIWTPGKKMWQEEHLKSHRHCNVHDNRAAQNIAADKHSNNIMWLLISINMTGIVRQKNARKHKELKAPSS